MKISNILILIPYILTLISYSAIVMFTRSILSVRSLLSDLLTAVNFILNAEIFG